MGGTLDIWERHWTYGRDTGRFSSRVYPGTFHARKCEVAGFFFKMAETNSKSTTSISFTTVFGSRYNQSILATAYNQQFSVDS